MTKLLVQKRCCVAEVNLERTSSFDDFVAYQSNTCSWLKSVTKIRWSKAISLKTSPLIFAKEYLYAALLLVGKQTGEIIGSDLGENGGEMPILI